MKIQELDMESELCYVCGNFAYFTNDWDNCSGDDWNDAPYQYNAGLPYNYCAKIAFEVNAHQPYNMPYPYSVDDINSMAVPWLVNEVTSIYANCTLEAFVYWIQVMGGKVYLPVEKLPLYCGDTDA